MKIAAVIFDLDGTLTRPVLDFPRIRAEIGVPQGPLLDGIEAMPPDRREWARQILHNHEDLAARDACLHPQTIATLERLRRETRQLALATSNRLDSVQTVCQLHALQFDSIVTRDDGPVKPHPFPLLHTCQKLALQPQNCLYVGDFLFDLLAAHAAGIPAVLLASQPDWQNWAHHADHILQNLEDLHDLIQQLELTPAT